MVLGVAELVEVGPARELEHGRRAAHEDVRVLGGRGQPFAAHALVDEADLVRARVRVRVRARARARARARVRVS